MNMKRDESFDGQDKAIFAGFITVCVLIGILVGMALMYGWLALNHQIIALEEEAATQIFPFLL